MPKAYDINGKVPIEARVLAVRSELLARRLTARLAELLNRQFSLARNSKTLKWEVCFTYPERISGEDEVARTIARALFRYAKLVRKHKFEIERQEAEIAAAAQATAEANKKKNKAAGLKLTIKCLRRPKGKNHG